MVKSLRLRVPGVVWPSVVVIAGLATGPALLAAAAPRFNALLIPIPNAVRINGTLGDAVWEGATPVSDFVQREPTEGAPPSQRTEFRVAYDASTVYVRVRAFDTEPEKIVGYLTRRDADSPSDWIRVMIDSYHDRRTAYEFAVNPAGVKQDIYWFNDSNRDESWDAVWDVNVSRDAQGWAAEFRIPFSQLRFAPGDSKTLGFAVARRIGRLNETSTWPLLSRGANGYVSSFGEVGGVSVAHAPKRLELVPYTVGNLTTERTGDNPLLTSPAPRGAFGLDVKYALTPGLTLTSTINPDFGQVEADPAVVNLSAFETFFSERRPFFVEGSGNFQFGLDCNDGQCTGLFYSRRIGRSPQGLDALPAGADIYTAVPTQTTILGAAKLTGRVGKYSIGAMQAVTEQESARVLDRGVRRREPVEPLASYSAGRVRREFDNQSSLGLMVTATNRQLVDTLAFIPSRAYVGGADFDWRFRSRYSVSGYGAASSVRGTSDAIARLQRNSRHYFQRPDLVSAQFDSTRTSIDGYAARIGISKIGGQRVRFMSTVGLKSPGFDVNDLGFFRRADERAASNWLQIRSDVPTRLFRSRRFNLNQWSSWNYDGDRLSSGQNINAHAVWINNWQTGMGVTVGQSTVDDRLTRGGPAGRTDGFTTVWSYVSSDDRKPVSLNAFVVGFRDGHGSWLREVEPSVGYRPMSALTLETGLRIGRNVRDYQWVSAVTNTTDHYIFGHLDQTTVAVTGRVNYTMSPTLSLQLYAQPFVSGADYRDFKELVDGRSPVYGQRYAPFAYAGNPDFNYKSFRTTNVLRWEYKPGSTLFVVWQQGREESAPYGDFRFRRDFRGIFGVPPRNVLLVKLAYWLNY